MKRITQEEIEKNPKSFQIIWRPDALPDEPPPLAKGRQGEFLSCKEDFALMEGGKGSGKSECLIFDCLKPRKYTNPRWHGVIFRREYKRLVEVIDRAKYWIDKLMPGIGAHWQGEHSRFVFESGAWLAFHNIENIGDEQKYHGWEIADLKFDQVEEVEESQFDFLVLQNRCGDKSIPCTVRMTANPPFDSKGTRARKPWVKKRFIDNKIPGQTYEIKTMVGEEELVLTYRRIFASVFDNPLLKNDKKYIARLASDPDPYRRKAMFEGDWNTVRGQFFSDWNDRYHVLIAKELPREWTRKAGLDYGNIKVIEFLAMDYLGNIYVEWEYRSEPSEAQPNGVTASQFGEESASWMLEREIGDDLQVVADSNMWSATGRDVGSDKTPAKIIQDIWNQKFKDKGRRPPRLNVVSKRAVEEQRYRVACNEAVRDYLRYEIDEKGELTKPPKLFVFDRCNSLKNTLPSLIADPNDPMDIADAQDDHDYDSLKMPLMTMRPGKEIEKPREFKNIDEYIQFTIFDKIMEDNLYPRGRTFADTL